MKRKVCLSVVMMMALALTCSEGANNPQMQEPPESLGVFPRLEAQNLEKQHVSLPEGFAGDHNLLLIAFKREQQENVDTWLREMKRFEAIPGFRYYELPTIGRLNPIARWFINRGMRSGITDREARERTITLYLDKASFRKALNLPNEDGVYAILVDREGRVHWRAEGDFDEAKGESLHLTLNRMVQIDDPAGRK